MGGWGIKNLQLFSRALAEKMGWHIINSQSLWQQVMYFKYIYPLPMVDWIRRPILPLVGASIVCKAITQSLPIIKNGLAWKIG